MGHFFQIQLVLNKDHLFFVFMNKFSDNASVYDFEFICMPISCSNLKRCKQQEEHMVV